MKQNMDEAREARFAVIDRVREAFADVPTEEIEQEVAKAVAEVRAEMTAEREACALDGCGGAPGGSGF